MNKQRFAGNIVILTGAGISAESGIATFRAADGLWENHRIEAVASPEGFAQDPDLVHRFYNQRRAQLKKVAPNAAHMALADLQKNHRQAVCIITQNVDNLHERAGANVLHMHGQLTQIRCQHCQAVSSWFEDCFADSLCPHCHQAGFLRPNIVWFGEMPFYLPEIEQALQKAQYFVAIGTSGAVYPAAGFVQTARFYGAKTLEINAEKTAISSYFDTGIYGAATQTVSDWVEAMLE